MNRTLNRLRLFLCTFSGEDDYIIRQCSKRIQVSFASIGFFVLFIFFCCWLSADLFLDNLFQNSELLSALIGIVWAMLVTNLYLLLLYTITPAILPIARKKGKHESNNLEKDVTTLESAFTVSFFFRMLFILILAIIIIQPFNVFIFSHYFKQNVGYASTLRQILSTRPYQIGAWSVTVFGCVVFLLPIYWKYAIRNRGGFYEKKRHIENKFVHDNYLEFKNLYASIFRDKILYYNRQTWENITPFINQLAGANAQLSTHHYEVLKLDTISETITKFEYWADHPFRTIHKKTVRNLSSEEDFLKDIYSENI